MGKAVSYLIDEAHEDGTYKREVPILPNLHINHSIRVVYFPEDENNDKRKAKDKKDEDIRCLPSLRRVVS